MFKLNQISKSYLGGKKIFDNLTISGFGDNDKIGIVGENGRGKSTLLKIIAGIIEPDSGEVKYNVKNPLIGYMPQELNEKELKKFDTVIDYFEDITGIKKLGRKLEKLYEEISSDSYDDFILDELGEIQTQYEKLGGYEFNNVVDKILDGLKIEGISRKSKIINLSGGQKSKILLAGSLLTGGDILLLDEPTNNLDIRSIEWLIDYIKSKVITSLIISHDRIFLNEVTNKTLELNSRGVNIYNGNYDLYKYEKELNLNKENAEYIQYIEKVNKLKERLAELQSRKNSTSKVKRVRDNNKAAANKARETAQNSSGKEIKKIKKQLEDIQRNKPIFNKQKKLSFSLRLEEKVYGGIIIENLDFKYLNSDRGIIIEKFSINSGEKVVILGDNGAGKSTFIKLINGELKSKNGEITISPGIVIGNYLQEHQNLSSDKTVFNFLSEQLDGIEESKINSILARFNFNKEDRNKKIGFLSPGQRSRMLLAYFTLKKCNTLIFDEPTNHLDLEGVEQLELALKEFNGNLIVTSHDKKFLENIGFNKFYLVEKGTLKEVNGLEDYFCK